MHHARIGDRRTGAEVAKLTTSSWGDIQAWKDEVYLEHRDRMHLLEFSVHSTDEEGHPLLYAPPPVLPGGDRITQVRAGLAEATRVRDVSNGGPCPESYPASTDEVADEVLLFVTQLDQSGLARGLVEQLTRKLALRHWGVDA